MPKAYKGALALARAMRLECAMKILNQSPQEDAFVQDPYRRYAAILAEGPCPWFWQDYGKRAVFDAGTVQALLRDRRLGRAAPENARPPVPPHLQAFAALEAVSLLELEPPTHTRLRGLVLRAFTSRRIAGLEGDMHDICDDLLHSLPEGPFDLLPAFCTALPIRVIARLLGVPESMSDRLLAWSHAMVAMYQAGRTYDTEVAADRAATEFTAFLSDYIEARRNTPGDDLISHLIAAETKDGTLSRAEMIGTCVLLLNAGHEATVHMLGNAVKTLLEWQTPLDAISPEHAERTVEELLRFDPPLHIFTRFAYQDVEIAGRHLQAGEDVMLVLGAAGRDPRTVQHPNRFDPFRISAPHAAFGGGLHFCLGAALARMEMRIGLQRLFATAPRLRLAAPPRYADSYHFHGLERLMVIR